MQEKTVLDGSERSRSHGSRPFHSLACAIAREEALNYLSFGSQLHSVTARLYKDDDHADLQGGNGKSSKFNIANRFTST